MFETLGGEEAGACDGEAPVFLETAPLVGAGVGDAFGFVVREEGDAGLAVVSLLLGGALGVGLATGLLVGKAEEEGIEDFFFTGVRFGAGDFLTGGVDLRATGVVITIQAS